MSDDNEPKIYRGTEKTHEYDSNLYIYVNRHKFNDSHLPPLEKRIDAELMSYVASILADGRSYVIQLGNLEVGDVAVIDGDVGSTKVSKTVWVTLVEGVKRERRLK